MSQRRDLPLNRFLAIFCEITWIIEEFQDGDKDRGFLESEGTSGEIVGEKKPSLMENLVD